MQPSQGKVGGITEHEAHQCFKKQVAKAPIESLIGLRLAIEEGKVDGKRYDTCFYGNLAKGVGYNFGGMSVQEICRTLRAFGEDLGIEIKADHHLDPIEMFCAQVGRGDTHESSHALATIYLWITEELERRSDLPDPAIEFTETPDGSEHEAFI